MEERISKLKDKVIEIIHSRNKKRKMKNKKKVRDWWDTVKCTNIHIMRASE